MRSAVAKAGKNSRTHGQNKGKNHVTTTQFLVRQGMGKSMLTVVTEPNHMSAQEFMAEQHRLTEIARRVNASWLNS